MSPQFDENITLLMFRFPDNLRVALLSYATNEPTPRIYASSESRWSDFHTALGGLLDDCVVAQGSGGAYLLPRLSRPSEVRETYTD